MKIVNKYCSQNLKIARIPLKCIECSLKCQGHICTIQEITTRYEKKKVATRLSVRTFGCNQIIRNGFKSFLPGLVFLQYKNEQLEIFQKSDFF